MIDGYCDGLVLASVALERLQISNFSPDFFDGNQMLNAPGQGAVAVETRSGGDILDMVKKHSPAEKTVTAHPDFSSFLGSH